MESKLALQLNDFGTMPLALALSPLEDGDNIRLTAELTIPRDYHRFVRKNMRDMLHLRVGEQSHRFQGSEHNNHLTLSTEFAKDELLNQDVTLSIKNKPFQALHIDANGGFNEHSLNTRRRLGVCDLRAFSEERIGEFPYDRSVLDDFDAEKHAPITDLHTHLTSQISAKDLITIAKENHAPYPVELLLSIDGFTQDMLPSETQRTQIASTEFKPMGDNALACEKKPEKGKKDIEAVDLNDLPESALTLLEKQMQLAEDRKITFGQLERSIYRYRNPLTKNDQLIEPVILKVAEEYARQGIYYTEQSVTGAMTPSWLAKALPALEKAKDIHGVDMRFLFGIPREMSARDMIDVVEKLKFVSDHPAIAGVDFLGFEANKSEYFEFAMRRIAEWAQQRKAQGNDDFVIRVHAGENGKNAVNVRHAMEIADEYDVKIRIGHGVHFEADPQMQKLAKSLVDKKLIALEFNPVSNLSLINTDFHTDIPAREWMALGVPVFICSDGAGAYQASVQENTIQMLHAGLSLKDLEDIRQREHTYIDEQKQHYEQKSAAFQEQYPQGNDAFSKEYETLSNTLRTNQLERRLHPDIAKKRPFLIAGASGGSWANMSPEAQLESEIGIAMLSEVLDFEQCYLAVGRIKDEGVTHCVDKTLSDLNDKTGLDLVGILASRQGQAMRVPRNITQIYPLRGELMNIPEGMVNFLEKHDGAAIYIGGSAFTRDFIHLCKEQDIPFGVMKDAKGASQDRARVSDPKLHVFEGAIGMVKHAIKMQEFRQDRSENSLLRSDADLSDEALQAMYDRIKEQKLKERRKEQFSQRDPAYTGK